jgi:hypothetical protein
MIKTFKYVPHHLVLDYARLGWFPHFDALADCPHGNYSVLMEWLCGCSVPLGKLGTTTTDRFPKAPR